MLSTMTSISHEGPFNFRGHSLRWSFRVVTKEGIKFVDFLTGAFLLEFRVSASDFVTFSYPKSSKGRRKEHWDGAWKPGPTAIANNENKKGWLTIKVYTGDGYTYQTVEGKKIV